LAQAGVTSPPLEFEDIAAAWRAACKLASETDKIIVFGSFLTVAAVMHERQRVNPDAIPATRRHRTH
jgi:folylpolyglutamate synthase/dihydropteroate synthase